MPAGRPSKYKPEYAKEVILAGAQGMSECEMAVALGVPRSTMQSWAETIPEFSAALTRAKEQSQAWWEKVGRDALYADRFQSPVWKKTMEARFRNEYTERREHTGADGGPLQVVTGVPSPENS